LIAGVILGAALVSCTSPMERADRDARAAGLEPQLIEGKGFRHRAYVPRQLSGDVLIVFIEGDGLPWTRGGTEIAADPTPQWPLALELAAATPGTVLYLGRPCYFGLQNDPGCKPDLWTFARYSNAVVDSMATAAGQTARSLGATKVVLVGYSGGGTMAVLMATRIPQAVAVVTVAANLDIDAWTERHAYLPLKDSLNPALEAPLPRGIGQWHLVGGRDTDVPPDSVARYLERAPAAHVQRFEDFDHRCCWRDAWPSIWRELEPELQARAGSLTSP
jgi:pimeloyl-ACP methyl ester carboxylesterase